MAEPTSIQNVMDNIGVLMASAMGFMYFLTPKVTAIIRAFVDNKKLNYYLPTIVGLVVGGVATAMVHPPTWVEWVCVYMAVVSGAQSSQATYEMSKNAPIVVPRKKRKNGKGKPNNPPAPSIPRNVPPGPGSAE